MADCSVRTLKFEEAKQVFWHSSAHLLGYASEIYFPGSNLTIGPATEQGFFYDFEIPGDRKVNESDYSQIEQIVHSITS
jgi:threonyl-tRNA synthetase